MLSREDIKNEYAISNPIILKKNFLKIKKLHNFLTE